MTDDTRPDALAALNEALAWTGDTVADFDRRLRTNYTDRDYATPFAAAYADVSALLTTLRAARLTPAPAAESGEPETRYPCLIQIAGGLAPGCLIAGTDYRVVEVRSHWPKGKADDPDNVTVIRFDPVARAQGTDAAGLEAALEALEAADALSKALKAWVMSGLHEEDWPSVRDFGIAYEKARAAIRSEAPEHPERFR